MIGGACVRCGREVPARTRGGLCLACAEADPSVPGWTLIQKGNVPFDASSIATLRRSVNRLPRTTNPSGRPEYPTLEQCRAAKRELERDNDPKHRGTIDDVAERLGVDRKSVKKRARDAGGWRQV